MNRSESVNRMLSFLSGMGVGLGMMYLLDPEQGRRRRALLRERAVQGSSRVRSAVARRGRELRDRARGLAGTDVAGVEKPLEPQESPEDAPGSQARRLGARRVTAALSDRRLQIACGIVGLTAAVVATRAIRLRGQRGEDERETPSYVHSPLQEAHVY